MARRCLVVGSYPPVPGPASAATVGAVERAWAAGYEVDVVSPRPSAAGRVIAFDGPGFAAELGRLCRQHYYQRVVVCTEPGWPFVAAPGLLSTPRRTAARLVRALASAGSAELVLTGPVADLHQVVLALPTLWPCVGTFTASSASLRAAAAASVPGAAVAMAAPSRRRLPLAELVELGGEAGGWPGAGGAGGRPGGPGSVGAMEPGQSLPAARARRLAGRSARRLLGESEPRVKAAALRALGAARRRAKQVPGLRAGIVCLRRVVGGSRPR